MTKYVFQQSAFSADEAVSVAPYASFTFTESATGDPASLWSDEAGTVPITGNEVLADEHGFVRAYLTAGIYDVAILSGSMSKTLTDVAIGAEYDAVAAAVAATAADRVQTGLDVISAAASSASASSYASTATTQAGNAAASAVAADASAVVAGSYEASMTDALLQMDGWTGIRQFVTSEGRQGYTSISTPASRFTLTKSTPDVYGFSCDQTHNGVLLTGLVFNSVIAAGQSVEVVETLSGTGFASASGMVVGFNPVFPADLTALAAGFVGYAWRSGSLTAYGPDGSTAATANAVSAGAVPTFVSGDQLRMKVTRNATGSGGTITLAVNGGTESVLSVTTLPSAAYYIFAGMRASPGAGLTSTGAVTSARTIRQTISSTTRIPTTVKPMRFRGNYNPESLYDPRDSVVAADGQNWECTAPCTGISPLSASWSSFWKLQPDAWPPAALPTFTARAVPTPFASYPFYLSPYYDGTPATATLTESVMDTFARIYADRMTGSAVYVSNDSGASDSNAGTSTAPLATIQAAIAKNPTLVYVAPGTYAPFSYRDDTHSAVVTQLAGGVVKWLKVWDRDTDTSKRVTIRVTAPEALSAKTWTATGGGHTDVYQATITTSGSNAPHRVLRTDTNDSYGFPTRLLKCTSLANLDAQSAGWYWDSVGKVLYIKMGASVDVNASKAVLDAYWLDTSGNSRIFLYGTVLALDGDFYLAGIDRVPLRHSTARAESWTCGITSFASASGGCRVDGGWVIAENERGHASNGDHLNGNPSGGIPGLIVDHRCYITDSGDHDAFQLVAASDSNRNAISAHGGCDHISVGTVGELSYGPVFADTSTTLLAAASWMIGCTGRSSLSSLETGNGGIGFLMQGLASAGDVGNRVSWLDGCIATGNSLWGAIQSTNGTMKKTGCSFVTESGTITAYAPGTP